MRRRDLIAPVMIAALAGACGGSSSETPPPLAPDFDAPRAPAAHSAKSPLQMGAAGSATGEASNEQQPTGESESTAQPPEGTWGDRRRRR